MRTPPLAALVFGAGLALLLLLTNVVTAEERPAVSEPARAAIEAINAYRKAAGVPAAELSPSLMSAAAGHVAYYDANKGAGMAGMGLHNQTPGALGFTGATMRDRAQKAGYTGGAVTENAGFGKLEAAIEWAMHTVNHRLPLIHPGAVDMGLAQSESSGFNIVAVGVRRGAVDAKLPSVYPPDGAAGVPTTWDGGESPNPAPGIPRPLGYPLTVAFVSGQKVEWQEVTLRPKGGAPLEISTPRTDWMGAAAIVPHRALAPSTEYIARVVAAVNGSIAVREWSFQTRSR